MRISALRLFNVKRFAGRGVAIEGIGDGVNVLCAANEFGKSTSFEALHALFFQPHSGTPGEVQRLRPYSGGNPLVEADISTAKGGFRITKQYYSGRSARVTDLATGRLVAQADEAENFIASLIRGGTAGPAGLLWVRQGMTGIERRSKSEEDGDKQIRKSLLQSVQGEVEAVTGGRRMADIMKATEEELWELVTPTGRPKAGGAYAAAIETRDRLAEQERKLGGDVAALREALDRRATVAKQLAEIDRTDERQERRRAIEIAQAALDQAKARSERLKTAETELRLLREQRDAASRDLETYRGIIAKAKALRPRLQEADQRRADAVTRRRAAIAAIEQAKSAAEAAEGKERETRGLLARLEGALKARTDSQRIAELTARLSAAEAARQALEEGEAKLALIKLPPEAVEALQALDIEIAKLRAVEDSARPSVTVVYQPDAAGRVTMDGTPLAGGEERRYNGQAELSLPGIGRITLQANRPSQGEASLERAEAKRRAVLTSMGVDDLSAARERQVRAQQLNAELRELKGRLSMLAPQGLARLREEVAALGSIDSEAIEVKADPVAIRAALAAAEEASALAKQALREAEPARANADDAFVAAETALATLNAESVQLAAALGDEHGHDQRERDLLQRLNEFDAGLVETEARTAALRGTAVDLESAEAALKRARSVEEAADRELNGLRQEIAELNGRVRAYADEAVEERWREVVEALSAATARADAFAREVRILQRLGAALETARSEARELYLKPVMAELRPLLGLLFDDVSITFDDRTLLPQTIRRNGQEEEVDRLSGGMREQLSVLTRLAFARLLARDGRPAPVILDDALVYSDDDRIEKMFDALHRQARDQQIIVFSCRQRAFRKLGGNVLDMINWQPS